MSFELARLPEPPDASPAEMSDWGISVEIVDPAESLGEPLGYKACFVLFYCAVGFAFDHTKYPFAVYNVFVSGSRNVRPCSRRVWSVFISLSMASCHFGQSGRSRASVRVFGSSPISLVAAFISDSLLAI